MSRRCSPSGSARPNGSSPATRRPRSRSDASRRTPSGRGIGRDRSLPAGELLAAIDDGPDGGPDAGAERGRGRPDRSPSAASARCPWRPVRSLRRQPHRGAHRPAPRDHRRPRGLTGPGPALGDPRRNVPGSRDRDSARWAPGLMGYSRAIPAWPYVPLPRAAPRWRARRKRSADVQVAGVQDLRSCRRSPARRSCSKPVSAGAEATPSRDSDSSGGPPTATRLGATDEPPVLDGRLFDSRPGRRWPTRPRARGPTSRPAGRLRWRTSSRSGTC